MTPSSRQNRRSPASHDRDRFDQFMKFLYGSEKSASTVEMARDLEAMGIPVAKLDASVSAIVARAAQPAAPAWLERARAKKRWFDAQVQQRTRELAERYRDSKELVAAMLSGELGIGVQARAGVFFRNKKAEDLSPEDLRTFIEDCELLEDLEAPATEAPPSKRSARDGNSPRAGGKTTKGKPKK